MIIKKEYCVRCKTLENLINYTSRINKSGDKIVYMMCNPCNSEKHINWYRNGNQQKVMDDNRRYLNKR